MHLILSKVVCRFIQRRQSPIIGVANNSSMVFSVPVFINFIPNDGFELIYHFQAGRQHFHHLEVPSHR